MKEFDFGLLEYLNIQQQQIDVCLLYRVVGYLPNCIETVVAMLATTSVGAVWSCCSTDFGVNAILDRFSQIEPKILFASNGYR